MIKIKPSEITPEHIYRSRRRFIAEMGALALAAAVGQGCAAPARAPETPSQSADSTPDASTPSDREPVILPTLSGQADELGDPLTSFEAVTNYNNYYEFSTDKEAVARLAQDLPVRPWTVEIGGLVDKPQTLGIEELLSFEIEERIYRMRCVEAWSMVIPWLGFPLATQLRKVEPLSSAKYVRFETLYDPDEMPGTKTLRYPWPYTEGLRLDEALHNLTILSVGLYGEELLPQNGAPIRLVVPWKYGFKSLKSIVRIDLVEEQPTSTWEAVGGGEYGFWANVNPDVPHPRWSQASESRIGETGRRETLMHNGYAEEVAGLYANPDDRSWYY